MFDQWQNLTDDADRWYYQRRTDPTGAPVILELHLGLQPHSVAASMHTYDEPAGHTADDLEGCVIRISLPAVDLYERWLLAGKDDAVVVVHLAEVEVPVVASQVPQSHVDALEAENAALKAALAALGAPAPGGPAAGGRKTHRGARAR
jgi:hypothetical protein